MTVPGVRAVVALGSNIPPRRRHLEEGVRRLGAIEGCAVEACSRVYETAPVGGPPQGAYLNAAVALRTALPPAALLQALLGVEAALGRRRGVPNGPRTLDLDLIFYGDRVIRAPGLSVPHPRFRERGFVLHPLGDIIPRFPDPETGRTVEELLRALPPGRDGVLRVRGRL